ncbi:MAG: hypothetical protein HQL15_03205 [Candidatus Omnitrophica bacterium]|nr:hypothetical protein [Candidatus Omnitrophota bacterium]
MTYFLRQYWFTFIIPSLVSLYSFFLNLAAGPYWLSTNLDPSYAYLLSGLYLVKGITPGHTDHPGTPLQLLICIVIGLFNIGRTVPDIVNRVLTTPEFYMHAVHAVLMLFSFLTSVGLAVYVYEKTKDKTAAILTQIPSLSFLILKSYTSSDAILPVVANLDPEPLLISIINLFNLCFLKLYFAKEPKEKTIATLGLGFIYGLGIATKFSCLPLLIIPLILLPWRMKPLFLAISAGSFIFWTLPILERYPLLWKWAFNLTTHTGQYANGSQGVIDLNSFITNWNTIFLEQWPLVITAVAALSLGLWDLLRRKRTQESVFMTVTAMGIILQFALVAKHPSPHYLVPGIGLFGVLFLFLYVHLRASTGGMKKIIHGFILIFMLTAMTQAFVYRAQLAHMTTDILNFHNRVHEKYKGFLFLGYYRSSGQETALAINDAWRKPKGVEEELSRLYPHFYYFDIFGYAIKDFKQQVWSNDLMSQTPGILFEGSPFNFSHGPYSVHLLEQGSHENVYLLTETSEKQADMLFEEAVQSFEAKDYSKAVSLAMMSRSLNKNFSTKVENFLRVVILSSRH